VAFLGGLGFLRDQRVQRGCLGADVIFGCARGLEDGEFRVEVFPELDDLLELV
jgi:hypothetical protein